MSSQATSHHEAGTFGRCPSCGRPLSEHDRHLRFRLPQAVLEVPESDRAARTWGNDVLMQVQGVGAFVRVLIPVRLTGGYTVTFGAWLSVSPEDLRHAWEVWWQPEYSQLRLNGELANMLPGWERDTYLKSLQAAVLDPEKAPYAVDSSDTFMRSLLTKEWAHEPVLNAMAPFGRR
jgi:hypothetical protein